MSGDGDGWVVCAAGHRHWGRFGAAGLLISDGERAVLQHRAPWTHEGGTWGLPGGARDSHEDAISTALREAQEEAAIDAASIEPVALWVDDHGGWSYTTVLARPIAAVNPHAANAESTEIRWWPLADIDALPLHYGFAATWPHLQTAPPPLLVIVDVRADPTFAPWFAALADNRGHDALDQLTRGGIPVRALPPDGAALNVADLAGSGGGRISSLLPSVVLIGDVVASGSINGPTVANGPERWWRRSQHIAAVGTAVHVAAWREIIERDAKHQTVVVTSDPATRDRMGSAATVVDPAWLLELLA